jgi:hypothetical protein
MPRHPLYLCSFVRSVRTPDLNEGLELLSHYVNNGHVDLPSRISLVRA